MPDYRSSTGVAGQLHKVTGKNMARVENDKISAVAAIIFPTAAICDVNRDRMGRIEPILMPAAAIETHVLIG